MDLAARIHGCLLGLACGDAMGTPAWFTPAETRARLGWIDRFLEPLPDHPVHAGLRAGQVTDDTQQAMAVAAAILEEGEVTPEGVARHLLAWYRRAVRPETPWVGPSTRRAMEALLRGADPRTTGAGGSTNGGAMRVAPVGCRYPGDPERAARAAAVACRPTHHTASAVAGAAAVAAAVAEALRPAPRLEDVLAAARSGAELGRTLAPPDIAPSVSRRIAWAAELAAAGRPLDERLLDLYELVGAGLAAAEAVPAAFGVLTAAEGDPVRAVIYGANLSGDADTVAAMAGAIAGAMAGEAAIPAAWADAVRAANPELDLLGTARRLARLAGWA